MGRSEGVCVCVRAARKREKESARARERERERERDGYILKDTDVVMTMTGVSGC